MPSRATVVFFVVLVLSSTSTIFAQDSGSAVSTTAQTRTSSPSATATATPTPSATSAPMTTTPTTTSGPILSISPPSTDPTTDPENVSSSRGDRPTGVTVTVTVTSSAAPSATLQNGAAVIGSVSGLQLGSVVVLVVSILLAQVHIL